MSKNNFSFVKQQHKLINYPIITFYFIISLYDMFGKIIFMLIEVFGKQNTKKIKIYSIGSSYFKQHCIRVLISAFDCKFNTMSGFLVHTSETFVYISIQKHNTLYNQLCIPLEERSPRSPPNLTTFFPNSQLIKN